MLLRGYRLKIRFWLLGFGGAAVLTCAATYELALQSSPPEQSPIAIVESEPQSAALNIALPRDNDVVIPEKESTPAVIVESNELPPPERQAALEEREDRDSDVGDPPSPNKATSNLAWLAFYVYSEIPPETKPADTVLEALKDAPLGTPIEEIKRVADILGLDFTFMKTVAKIESSFNPKARTGSYIGLFQISNYEFGRFGSGDILDARANAVAAALKIIEEAVLFETFTHRKPTLHDLYLIHQQGVDGAAQHISHPGRLAWKSMCATDEGKKKGEKWCKRAIWGNTLPDIKRTFKTVDKISSAAFVEMWQQRMSHFYARYSEASVRTN